MDRAPGGPEGPAWVSTGRPLSPFWLWTCRLAPEEDQNRSSSDYGMAPPTLEDFIVKKKKKEGTGEEQAQFEEKEGHRAVILRSEAGVLQPKRHWATQRV